MTPDLNSPIGSLVAARLSCVIGCQVCNWKTKISALEAVASYGGLMKFKEVETAIRSRCVKKTEYGCHFTIQPTPSPFGKVDRDKQGVEGNAVTKTPR